MSPRAATARRGDENDRQPVLNGNHLPLAGDQDMDGETLQPGTTARTAEPVFATSGPSASARTEQPTTTPGEQAVAAGADVGSKAGSLGRPPMSSDVGQVEEGSLVFLDCTIDALSAKAAIHVVQRCSGGGEETVDGDDGFELSRLYRWRCRTQGLDLAEPPLPGQQDSLSTLCSGIKRSLKALGQESKGLGRKERLEEAADPVEGEAQGLDPLSVVLTGMAQLQSVVTELTSPKASYKPEVIKPGVTALPDLPGHGPESSLAFADWLHASRPALADVSDTSEELWQRTVDEATAWYNEYLRMDPLARLTAKPEPSSDLAQTKWVRVSRRIETMIIAAAPKDVRDELSASRSQLHLMVELTPSHLAGLRVEDKAKGRTPKPPKAGTESAAGGTTGSTNCARNASDFGLSQRSVGAVVQEYEARLCSHAPGTAPVALLDSGATHPVVAFEPSMTGLEKVPVTLAGDAKQEWLRTQGGTLHTGVSGNTPSETWLIPRKPG
ncbi:unnamed protein product, partial [Symbiodinium necroappetens]